LLRCVFDQSARFINSETSITLSAAAVIVVCLFWLGLTASGGASIFTVAIFAVVMGLFALLFTGLVWFARKIYQLNRPASLAPAQ